MQVDEETAGLQWDQPEEDLPADLLQLWERASTGTKKLDVRRLMQEVPVYKKLPSRPPENNHRGDGKGQQDRTLKSYQASVGHLMRCWAVIHGVIQQVDRDGDMVSLSQQSWLMAAELWNKINDQRKQWSIPGTVPTDDNVLFSREDLSHRSTQEKSEKYARCLRPRRASLLHLHPFRFNRPYRGYGSFRPHKGTGYSSAYGKKGKGKCYGSYYYGYGSQNWNRDQWTKGKGYRSKSSSPAKAFKSGQEPPLVDSSCILGDLQPHYSGCSIAISTPSTMFDQKTSTEIPQEILDI